MGTRWIVELYLWVVYINQEPLNLCGWWNIVKNLDIAYKLWNAKNHPAARLFRQIDLQSSLIVSYLFLPFTNMYTNNGNAPVETSRQFQNLSFPITFTSPTYRLFTKAVPREVFHDDVVAFDLYCLSMKHKLDNGVCKRCGK